MAEKWEVLGEPEGLGESAEGESGEPEATSEAQERADGRGSERCRRWHP